MSEESHDPNPSVSADSDDPITLRNRQNAQFSTGPKTDEGKAASSGNAVTHGFCSSKPRADELTLAVNVYDLWQQEFGASGAIETTAIMGAAQSEARRRVIQDLITERCRETNANPRAFRRQPFLDEIHSLQRSLRIWTIVRDDDFEPGEGLQVDFPALLRDLDPKATPRNIGAKGEVHEFVFLHNRAVATPRYKELCKKYADKKRVAESDLEAAEYQRLDGRLRKATERLREWVVGRIDQLIAAIGDAEKRLAADDAQPERPFSWQVETAEGRLMSRYLAEAEASVRRHLKLFDDHRRRLIRTDIRREQYYRKQGTTTMHCGDLVVQLPPRYSLMPPRLRLETAALEFQHEMRYYPERDMNEASYPAAIRDQLARQELASQNGGEGDPRFGRTEGLKGSQRPPENDPNGPATG